LSTNWDWWWLGLFALEDTELLPQEQDLDIFVPVVSTAHPDKVHQQRHRLLEKKEEHGRSLAGTMPRNKGGRACEPYGER